jgi:hypothetical protein
MDLKVGDSIPGINIARIFGCFFYEVPVLGFVFRNGIKLLIFFFKQQIILNIATSFFLFFGGGAGGGLFRFFKSCNSMLQIRDILVWIRIRIRGSMPLTNGSGSFYFRH